MLLARLGAGPVAASRLVLRRGADALPRFRPPIPAGPSVLTHGAAAPLAAAAAAVRSSPGQWAAVAASRSMHQHRQGGRHNYYQPPPPPPPPPRPSAMVPTSRLKARAIIFGVVGANLVVYYWWRLARTEGPHNSPWSVRWSRTTEKLDWMRENFVLSADNVLQGRWWTLLTSAFSHYDTIHLAVNMTVFHFSATMALHLGFGAARLAFLSLGSALTASAASLLHEQTTAHQGVVSGALGASGMVEGIMAAVACTAPRHWVTLLIPPVPMPLGVLFVGFLSWDMYRLYLARTEGPTENWTGNFVGYAAHLGGAFFGVAYWFVRIRPAFKGLRFL
ncbi:hypothetical protein RB595_007670 [Gaeumannomyces hyphopodioides]